MKRTGVDERFVCAFQHDTDLRVHLLGQLRMYVEKCRVELPQTTDSSDFANGISTDAYEQHDALW